MNVRTELLKQVNPSFTMSCQRLGVYRQWASRMSANSRKERLIRFEKRLQQLFARQAY